MTVGTAKKHGSVGFTLIELMVVVAIIAVLTSLLLPSLSRAKETGRSAVCKYNMHQLLWGMYLYSDDNNDFLPWPGAPDRGLLPDWVFGGDVAKSPPDPKQWVLPGFATHAESGSIFYYVMSSQRVLPVDPKYTNSFPVYRCPSSGAIGRARRVTYSMNGWFDPVGETTLRPQGVQRSAVANPSQKILLVDESAESTDNSSFQPGATSGLIFQQHNTHVNMGFVDSHIDTFRRQRVIDLQLGQVSLTRGFFDPYYK